MFLEFIRNLPEKFRIIICEIQELPSKSPEIFMKNSERKISQRLQVGIEPAILSVEVKHANLYAL